MADYQLFGGPGSPYSHKLRAVLRYRRLSHTWSVPQGSFSGAGSLGSDVGSDSHLAKAAKGIVPVLLYPDGTYKADSTPIIYDLESRHANRSVIPPHPAIAFIAHLIEDMSDEFLPMPMFHYRWTDDQVWCSRRQMIGWSGAMDDNTLQSSSQAFLDRQAGLLARSGVSREQMDAACNQFYTVMEEQLTHSLYLFGSRPSIADFGLYGQLTQYAVDPTLCNRMKDKAVRTYQWTHWMDDLSGVEGEWQSPDTVLTEQLAGFLRFTARFYFPVLEVVVGMAGLDDLEASANGMKYKVKTFLDLKRELADLCSDDRSLIQGILTDTGCWEALQFKEGEVDKVVPVLPA